MSKLQMTRGRTLLLNLNNARIRHSRAKQAGASDLKALAHEVAHLHAMWREHVKRAAVSPASKELEVTASPIAA